VNNPRILYISIHAVLEYDELCMLTELGYDCFSLGAYTDPAGHQSLPRPGIGGMVKKPYLETLSQNMPRTELSSEFVDHFDVIIVMDGYGAPEIIERNWPLFSTKKVIWRTIGQSIPEKERRMEKYRRAGMKIIRYSPAEEELEFYQGADALIRFYKDPKEFGNWNGNTLRVINLTQSLKARRDFCGYDITMRVGPGFPFKVYGTGNEDLGEFSGGELTYDAMKGVLRDCRVFFYCGTWPASYTLSFVEAMMTGIPIVSVGDETWRHKDHPRVKLFEVPHILRQGDEGFVFDNVDALKSAIQRLFDDHDYAKEISAKAREKAIRLFGKENVAPQWQSFMESL
jgi:hypothetical protein